MSYHPKDQKPLDLGGAPDEEGVSEADAAERLDLDPEEQENFTDEHGHRTQVDQEEPDESGQPETAPDREKSIELDAPEYDEA